MRLTIRILLCGITLCVSTKAYSLGDTLFVSGQNRTHLVFPENIRHFDIVGEEWRVNSFENLLMIQSEGQNENSASVIVKAGEETHFFVIKTTNDPVALAQVVDNPLAMTKKSQKKEEIAQQGDMPYMYQLLLQYRMDVAIANLKGMAGEAYSVPNPVFLPQGSGLPHYGSAGPQYVHLAAPQQAHTWSAAPQTPQSPAPHRNIAERYYAETVADVDCVAVVKPLEIKVEEVMEKLLSYPDRFSDNGVMVKKVAVLVTDFLKSGNNLIVKVRVTNYNKKSIELGNISFNEVNGNNYRRNLEVSASTEFSGPVEAGESKVYAFLMANLANQKSTMEVQFSDVSGQYADKFLLDTSQLMDLPITYNY